MNLFVENMAMGHFPPFGNIAKVKAAYQDFLTHSKDADPDIPIYKQVGIEYAKPQ